MTDTNQAMTDAFSAVLASLKRQSLRSALCAAAVATGVASTVLLTTVVTAVASDITRRFAALGSNLLIVSPNTQAVLRRAPARPVTMQDVDAMRRRLALTEAEVMPALDLQGSIQACRERIVVRIMGVHPQHAAAGSWKLARGRFVTPLDIQRASRVAVIDGRLIKELSCLAASDAELRISGRPFRIAGVTEGPGGGLDVARPYVVLVPLSTAERMYGNVVRSGLTVTIRGSQTEVAGVLADRVRRLMRVQHRILPWEPDDFSILTHEQMIDGVSQTARMAKIILGSMLGLSLVIASVGIMNSLFVSVVERRSEIGLRRAVGARRRHIAILFVLEALVTSGLGALLGAAGGVLAGIGVTALLDLPRVLETEAIVVSVLASVGLGILAAAWPALRATRLTPIEALHVE